MLYLIVVAIAHLSRKILHHAWQNNAFRTKYKHMGSYSGHPDRRRSDQTHRREDFHEKAICGPSVRYTEAMDLSSMASAVYGSLPICFHLTFSNMNV